ncbi:MAG: DUF433 domain-containing protein [Anaerolineae bacterium]|nr:DUF433 domain-containing protein [Anaerolineae bacterium]
MDIQLSERVVASNDVLHGKPRIAGTRVPVFYVLRLLASGKSIDEIISDQYYPELAREDVLACLTYASHLVEMDDFVAVL